MAESALKKLSPRHDAIAEWLIANPQGRMGECALAFRVSQSWLSCIVHSDVFQAYYRKLRGDYIDERVMPLRDKLHNLAHQAVDRLGEQMQTATQAGDRQFIADVAELTLGKLGYGQKAGVSVVGGQVAVFASASPEDIQRARAMYRKYQEQLTGVGELPSVSSPQVEEPTPDVVEEPRNGHPVLPPAR